MKTSLKILLVCLFITIFSCKKDMQYCYECTSKVDAIEFCNDDAFLANKQAEEYRTQRILKGDLTTKCELK